MKRILVFGTFLFSRFAFVTVVTVRRFRATLALATLALCLVAFFGLQYKALRTPGAKERLLALVQLVRDTPAEIFYPVFIGFTILAPGLFFWMLVNQKRWSRMATKDSVFKAKKVVLSLWCAENPMIIEGSPVIRFRHVSFGRQSFILPVRPGHPDIEQFRRLKDGDTVEFESLSEGMECALEHELCGYLRIKSIS